MGTVRYPIKCAGCGASVNLRLTVGNDSRQPFFFPCPVCEVPTRGELTFDPEPRTGLILEAGEVLDAELHDVPSVTISADIPSMSGARELWDVGGSAFMHFSGIVGVESMKHFIDVSEAARLSVREVMPVLSRLIAYTRSEDWERFDTNIATVLPAGAPRPTKVWQRLDAVHRALDALLLPVLVVDGSGFYPRMKLEWNDLWRAAEFFSRRRFP